MRKLSLLIFLIYSFGKYQVSLSSSSSSLSSSLPSSLSSSSPNEPKHQRRVRYKGSYPKKYSEKYKELQQDAEVIQRVTAKGSTPAGMHVPIMVNECLEYLGLQKVDDIKQNLIAVDVTLGYGGHSSAILQQIRSKNGSVYALDQDIESLERTTARINENLSLIHI